MRAALLVIAGLALAGFVAVSFVLPQMVGAEAKEAAQALVTGAEAPKQLVAAAAEKSGSLSSAGGGIKIAPKNDPKLGEFKWIAEANGAIRGWNEKNAIEISVTPKLEGGKVSWVCRGYPNASMPASCGGKN
jgi:Flp pilus assembly protein CpaB